MLESAVVGVPHRDFGEGVTAVVVTIGKVPLGEADVLKALRTGWLTKLPKFVLLADELPRNTMGKVQNVLR